MAETGRKFLILKNNIPESGKITTEFILKFFLKFSQNNLEFLQLVYQTNIIICVVNLFKSTFFGVNLSLKNAFDLARVAVSRRLNAS